MHKLALFIFSEAELRRPQKNALAIRELLWPPLRMWSSIRAFVQGVQQQMDITYSIVALSNVHVYVHRPQWRCWAPNSFPSVLKAIFPLCQPMRLNEMLRVLGFARLVNSKLL